MSNIFTEAEIAYLESQPLGRLATVGPGGRPHVAPVGVFYDPQADAVVVAGHAGSGFGGSRKFRDAQAHPEVAYVVDDLASLDPWQPRGIEIRGTAETFSDGGEELGARITGVMPFDAAWLRIRACRVLAWGIDGDSFELSARDVA
ncbi:PPOX class F420-dependent oxidoreductase [Jiangella alkaliphila]|uniref:Pyridoxamine 5'-phosphate oxidase family protein n=1 Tax=Jiangella alkaliphila TaxID=419479 RepID=A0A1H2LU40_9ACTN|nr:PPOX class F420-dependent oxidoreductase [Jiangella alkaliphila]SDU84459.1 pyridoxamine 5'-phosphate oxidase family protein [Jiangella alkaliphila]